MKTAFKFIVSSIMTIVVIFVIFSSGLGLGLLLGLGYTDEELEQQRFNYEAMRELSTICIAYNAWMEEKTIKQEKRLEELGETLAVNKCTSL